MKKQTPQSGTKKGGTMKTRSARKSMRYFTPSGYGYELIKRAVRVWYPDGSFFMTMSLWGFNSYFGYEATAV
jgi:hypothetical protein